MLTLGVLSLAFETAVALLLSVMIYFAIKLNRRLGQMREREVQMRMLIEEFNNAAVRAQESAGTLKAVGDDAERSLRGLVERSQALRDELMFMIDRGDQLGASMAQSLSSKSRAPSHPVGRPTGEARARDDEDLSPPEDRPHSAKGVSRAELELERALRSARGV